MTYIVGESECMWSIVDRKRVLRPIFYYVDTRNKLGFDDFSDIFSSTPYPQHATKYLTYDAAQAWNDEFLHGEGAIYKL